MKYVLIVIGALIGAILVIWAIGSMLSQSHTAEVSAQFEAEPETIFNMIRDVKNYPMWRTNVDGIEMLESQNGLPQWREYYTNNDPLTFQITDERPGEYIVSEIVDDDQPFGGSWTYQIEFEEGNTVLTITENGEVYNPFFRFVSRFILGHEYTMNQFVSYLEGAVD